MKSLFIKIPVRGRRTHLRVLKIRICIVEQLHRADILAKIKKFTVSRNSPSWTVVYICGIIDRLKRWWLLTRSILIIFFWRRKRHRYEINNGTNHLITTKSKKIRNSESAFPSQFRPFYFLNIEQMTHNKFSKSKFEMSRNCTCCCFVFYCFRNVELYADIKFPGATIRRSLGIYLFIYLPFSLPEVN